MTVRKKQISSVKTTKKFGNNIPREEDAPITSSAWTGEAGTPKKEMHLVKKIKFTIVALVFATLMTMLACYALNESPCEEIQTLSDSRIVFPSHIGTGDTVTYLRALQENRDYHIIIDNFGGSAWDTIAIINRIDELQEAGFTITTETYGYAMSGGAFIFIMGDIRIIHDGASLMFHGSGMHGAYGVRESLRELALTGETTLEEFKVKALSIIDNKFMKMLTLKTALTDEEIADWLYKLNYNYMSSDEAMELGIATELR